MRSEVLDLMWINPKTVEGEFSVHLEKRHNSDHAVLQLSFGSISKKEKQPGILHLGPKADKFVNAIRKAIHSLSENINLAEDVEQAGEVLETLFTDVWNKHAGKPNKCSHSKQW